MRPFFTLALLLLCLCGCSRPPGPPVLPESEAVVPFRGRQVDLRPFLTGFPFSSFLVAPEAGRLFYLAEGERTQWRSLRLRGGNADLWAGEVLGADDLAGRTIWSPAYRPADRGLYWLGDERGDEVINLWRLDTRSGRLERLTDAPYIYGWRWNGARDEIAYVARADSGNELRLLDLRSGRDALVARDHPGLRFTWGAPAWRPDGRGFVITALRDGDRRHGNLAYISRSGGAPLLLTDPARPRTFPVALAGWAGDETLLFFSDEDGFRNLYACDLRRGEVRQRTHFRADIRQAAWLRRGGARRLLLVVAADGGTRLVIADPSSGQPLREQPFPGEIDIAAARGDRLWVGYSTPEQMYHLAELAPAADSFALTPRFRAAPAVRRAVEQARAERLTFPTFDTDPATGRPRNLPGYLLHPRRPPPAADAMLVIQAFYGGDSRFHLAHQVLAAAGIYVFSPAVRGGEGRGRAFASLNDGDLGGDEIIDLVEAGRFLARRLGIPESRIGLIGESHGGYAVLRALTLPPLVNGRRARFDWGFGISHAGISDLPALYRDGGVSEWVRQEAGDPAADSTRLRERSPLLRARELRGALLLTHGANDRRVPPDQSRWMADSLRRRDRPVTYVELPGTGHTARGPHARLRQYRAWLEFLENVYLQENK